MKKGNLLIIAGLLLVLVAGSLALWYFKEDQDAGMLARDSLDQLKEAIENGPSDGYNPDNERTDTGESEGMGGTVTAAIGGTSAPDFIMGSNLDMPVEMIDGIGYIGVLSMPSIERELPIIAAYDYPLLATAPCRFYGSVYTNNMVICGHSYITHFRPIRGMSAGDPVTFVDVDGNVFKYKVAMTEILAPTDVEIATNGEWDLTLFTCTSDSASRFTVRCMREGSDVVVVDAE